MNRSLIRASQLNPDVSGLVYQYTKDVYPEYRTYSGVSGVDIVSGAGRVGLVSAERILKSGIVNQINGITGGSVQFTGFSGISVSQSGTSYIAISYNGGSVASINGVQGAISLTGLGDVTISNNSSTIYISGKSITGEGGISTYNSGQLTYIDGRRLVYTANGQSGDITLVGSGGIYVSSSSGTLVIDGTSAANSGVMTINGQRGDLEITGFNSSLEDSRIINTYWEPVFGSFVFKNEGVGWGAGNILDSLSVNQVYMGNNNASYYGYNNIINGDYNEAHRSTGINTINSDDNYIQDSTRVTLINSSGCDISDVKDTVIINGKKITSARSHSVIIGNGIPNSSFDMVGMRSISTGETVKFLKPHGATSFGVSIPTGSVLVGQMDYVFLNSNISDFWANFDALESGTYGRKYFMIQRNNSDMVSIKDQADLFGGSQSYQVALSGASDGNFYVYSSGVSGQDHISQASLHFSVMSFQDFVYNSEVF